MTTDLEKECDLIAEYLLNIDEKYSGKIKNIRRIRRSLNWFAEEDNEKCLLFIKDIADKYVHQDGNDINDAWIFHYSQRNELFHKLDLDYVLKIMYESNTNFKNNILYNLGSTHKELLEFKILSAPRIFPADKVYEVLREDIRKYYMVSPYLSRAYGIEYNKITVIHNGFGINAGHLFFWIWEILEQHLTLYMMKILRIGICC